MSIAHIGSVRRLVVVVLVGAVLGWACSSDGAGSGRSETTDTVSSTTTTTIPNRAPSLRIPQQARADVGRLASDAIVASDPDGDVVTIRVSDGPDGFRPTTNARGSITGFEWEPVEPGEWTIEVSASDPDGLETRGSLLLVARNPRDRDLQLAMGDSVAAGFGRDRSDFLRPDDCWRAETSAYPKLVFDSLVDAGSLAADAEFVLVACSETTAAQLSSRAVGDWRPEGSSDEELTQLDWAVALNPTVITLTVGRAEVDLADPSSLISTDPDVAGDPRRVLDRDELARRIELVATDLDRDLARILTTTDAHIALTTYYGPTAADPVGVAGCRGECFREVSATILEELNAAIADVAQQRPDRITLVRLDDAFAFRGAPNGLGPDALRDLDLGPLPDVIGRFTGTTSPHCSDGEGPPTTLVSALDCVHPNDEGHREIADHVVAALLDL